VEKCPTSHHPDRRVWAEGLAPDGICMDAAGAVWVQAADQLLAISPSPIVALNRAVAVAELEGPQVALHLVDELPLDRYYLFHAIRADLLRRLGRVQHAEAAYRDAIKLTDNAAEIAFMKQRISASSCPGPKPPSAGSGTGDTE
jgi:predicted RNA polymerase sigma factor